MRAFFAIPRVETFRSLWADLTLVTKFELGSNWVLSVKKKHFRCIFRTSKPALIHFFWWHFHRSKSIREAIQLIWNVEIPSGQNQSKTRLRSVGLEASAMVLLMVLIGFGGGRGMSRGTVACSRTGLHTTCTWFWGIWTLLLNTLLMWQGTTANHQLVWCQKNQAVWHGY